VSVAGLDLAALRDAALEMVEETDAIALHAFERGVGVQVKADGSPVTAADREVEAVLRRRLADAYPGHAVLGEEEGGGLVAGTPTWVVDPIDATKNFVRGLPIWATLVALVVDGDPVVGVASAPAMRQRWDAARGLGARQDGRPIAVSDVDRLEDAHVLHGGLDWFRRAPGGWELLGRLADRAWRTRGFGDFWMHLLVAAGLADVALERDVQPWDIAAVACIVDEAGGRLTAWGGGPALASGEALSTNGRLHGAVVDLVRGAAPPASRP
jgi:histidinol-phosphatase